VATKLLSTQAVGASSLPKSDDGDGRVVVADKECEQTSVIASSASPTFSPNADVRVGGNSAESALEEKCVAEFIALLVRKGARVVIQTEDRR
jgi:hypothetical protein